MKESLEEREREPGMDGETRKRDWGTLEGRERLEKRLEETRLRQRN